MNEYGYPDWLDQQPEGFDVVLTSRRNGSPEIVVPLPSDQPSEALAAMVRMIRTTHNLPDDTPVRSADVTNYEAV